MAMSIRRVFVGLMGSVSLPGYAVPYRRVRMRYSAEDEVGVSPHVPTVGEAFALWFAGEYLPEVAVFFSEEEVSEEEGREAQRT